MTDKDLLLTDEELTYHWTSMAGMSSTDFGILRAICKAQLTKCQKYWVEEISANPTISTVMALRDELAKATPIIKAEAYREIREIVKKIKKRDNDLDQPEGTELWHIGFREALIEVLKELEK
jgi:pantoate kinase